MSMSARRQPSTTSLSKYARASSPGLQNRSLDFCNAFWGLGDGGVDVLFARMRGASRTVEELRNFWKERDNSAAIEEDYAKRLAKLSKVTLGRDEIGELRNSLDTVRLETDKQAGFHLTLAQQIRSELEAQSTSFHARQMQHKKSFQTAIEKEFKAKQTQETYVNKAREKYEADCVRINSYTAQSTLVQGKDLDRITLKLERAQQTVQANERDFANFAKALQDTVQKWEQDWKAFCDSCQDLEEQRMEFMKDNMWAYANAVSTVCVSDDESCERMRLSLEQMEPEKDMENFVRDYGTGNLIPDPPAFVNYNTPDAIPSSSARPTSRPAHFVRSSQREPPLRQNSIPPPEDEPIINSAGVGAGGGRRVDAQLDGSPISRHSTQIQPGPSPQPSHVNGYNGNQNNNVGSSSASTSSAQITRRPTSATQASSYRIPAQDPHAETIDPTAETFIKVGNNAYRVDLSRDPQQQGPSSSRAVASASPTKQQQNGGVDPLAKHLEELQNAVSSSGSVRRNTTMKHGSSGAASLDLRGGQQMSPRKEAPTSSSLSLPAGTPTTNLGGSTGSHSSGSSRDYRNSAEVVVGTHPSAVSTSRPASPNPPTAAFMVPKTSPSPMMDAETVQEVLADYQQSLPGERKSISRSNSRRGSFVGQSSQSPANASGYGHNHSLSQGQNLARPSSQLGHAGIGAHGGSRSNSPQPPSRGPSPQPNQTRNSYISPPAPNVARATSPNTVGIALDPSGRVLHDEMAQHYQQQQQQQQRQPPPQQQPQYNPIIQQQPQRRSSYINPVNSTMAPPPAQPSYPVTPPPQMYQAPPPPQSYIQAPPTQPVYNQTVVPYQSPTQQPMYQQNPYGNGIQRGTSAAGSYYSTTPAPVQQQQQPNYRQAAPQQQQQNHLGYGYRDASPVGRTPSPQPPPQAGMPPPTGQTTDDGSGVLFYVKALYDYTATIDEEFDFQAGDIIAVTSTPEDGWWSGELLDEARRQPGRHVFPSNFVCLF
ncbi:hypothetical protein BDQ12DRAFT_661624 [Crucibulum laeve]|uniref:SH3 domain-containing protein n=1 Tax=Crucibulum laeve TaxID=68775 RepID=A0A5C3MJY5_9AGAR|nr:hypothetical protein BDQ12DRAFT_661624 [Crucibulum laeve]